MPRKRVVKKDTETATFDAIAAGEHHSNAPDHQTPPVEPELLGNLRRLVATALSPSTPWNDKAFLWSVVWSDSSGAALPMVSGLPSGERARELREACGVSSERVSLVLTIGKGIIPEYEQGLRTLVPELLDNGYGHLRGIFRLYGCMEAWVNQLQDEFTSAHTTTETS